MQMIERSPEEILFLYRLGFKHGSSGAVQHHPDQRTYIRGYNDARTALMNCLKMFSEEEGIRIPAGLMR